VVLLYNPQSKIPEQSSGYIYDDVLPSIISVLRNSHNLWKWRFQLINSHGSHIFITDRGIKVNTARVTPDTILCHSLQISGKSELVQMFLDCMSDMDRRSHRHHDDIMKLGKKSVFVNPLSTRSLQFKINLNNPSANYG
jgi:hypothetical protein